MPAKCRPGSEDCSVGPTVEVGQHHCWHHRATHLRRDFDAGDEDLFGDGAIRLLETPGHSAGHMSVLLQLPETGPVLLTADAADNRAQWEGRARPRAHREC